MNRNKSYVKKKLLFLFCIFAGVSLFLVIRLFFLMLNQSEHYGPMALEVQQRERRIKAERGNIYDANGTALTGNRPVCTISVIHSQITEPEKVIQELSDRLSLDAEKIRKKVEKKSMREKIQSNVDKETADAIRSLELDGVVVDEDYKRFYPYGMLASHVLGFTGADNQGILGLEVQYEDVLRGEDGKILTLTTANGIELAEKAEERQEPVRGKDLITSLDINIQMYAQQLAEKLLLEKKAKGVRIIVMNPQDGSIYAMVNVPEFDLNAPYELVSENDLGIKKQEKISTGSSIGTNDLLNRMWRNLCISDTYEPGSTFKIITASAALEEGVVSEQDHFYCPGYKKVGDRTIRCHKIAGHGAESFAEGIQNSCNPVFIEIGERLGVKNFYKYFRKFGLFDKTGIDLPGEANSIMHKQENVKEVELATISFGQSFQITPIQLVRTVSQIINGGHAITPHFGVAVMSEMNLGENGTSERGEKLSYPVDEKKNIVSEETSEKMRRLLESVVSVGGGKNAYISGFAIGGKTATSEKLPRRSGKYVASFLGFAPADNPKVITLLMIDEPQGAYYGGVIAAPAVKELYQNILPYLLHK